MPIEGLAQQIAGGDGGDEKDVRVPRHRAAVALEAGPPRHSVARSREMGPSTRQGPKSPRSPSSRRAAASPVSGMRGLTVSAAHSAAALGLSYPRKRHSDQGVAENGPLLLQAGSDDQPAVGDVEQLVVGGDLQNGHMGEQPIPADAAGTV